MTLSFLHFFLSFQSFLTMSVQLVLQTAWEQSKMTCWYHSATPRLKLKPARFERVFVKPEIIIMRNILMDSEMDKIKELASPRVT